MLSTLRRRLSGRPDGPFFDEDAASRLPRRRYLIATSARTGSTFLCARIAEYGRLGFPMEFLNPSYIAEFDRLFPSPSLADFERFVGNRFVSKSTGVFGMKTDWWSFREAQQLGMLDSLTKPLDLIVHLRREDFVAQAVSLALAVNSGVWHLRDALSSAEPAHAGQRYDRAEIELHARNILNQEYYWRQYFQQSDATVLDMTYEQVVQNVDDAVGEIARAFDIGLPPRRNALPAMERTLTRVAGEWAERFRAERGEFIDFWSEYRGLASAA